MNAARRVSFTVVRRRSSTSGGGRPPIPIDWKVKMLFVQHLYNLSDPELEDQMIDRLSFQEFIGITFNTEIPDFTTVWRFKEALLKEKLLDRIFEIILQQVRDKRSACEEGNHGRCDDHSVRQSPLECGTAEGIPLSVTQCSD